MLIKRYGESQANEFMEKIQHELELTLAKLPDIGTEEENKWSGNMPSAAFSLAVYRVLTPKYATLEEVGQILGVTRERVRQVQLAALVRLREISRRAGVVEMPFID